LPEAESGVLESGVLESGVQEFRSSGVQEFRSSGVTGDPEYCIGRTKMRICTEIAKIAKTSRHRGASIVDR
jgi:hypothetical protein